MGIDGEEIYSIQKNPVQLPNLGIDDFCQVVEQSWFLVDAGSGVDNLVQTGHPEPVRVASLTRVHVVAERQDYLENTA